jgi:hypothetical protein
MKFWIAAGLGAGLLAGQTQVDLRTQAKAVDFEAAPFTKPLKSGAALPGVCQSGELFFLKSAPAGSNLYACVANNVWARQGTPGAGIEQAGAVLTSDGTRGQWTLPAGDVGGTGTAMKVQGLQQRPVSGAAPQNGQALLWDGAVWRPQTINGAPGTVTLEASGTVVAARGVVNVVPGTGVLHALTDTGSKVTVQSSLDTAVALTKAAFQSGQSVVCASAGGTGAAYSCALSPALTGYTAGMALRWIPGADSAGGPTTLNVDLLGAAPLKLADGTTDPAAGALVAGRMYEVWYDGAVFRLMHGAPAAAGAGVRPACDTGWRGALWLTAGGAGVKDAVEVCAKDGADGYAWRPVY